MPRILNSINILLGIIIIVILAAITADRLGTSFKNKLAPKLVNLGGKASNLPAPVMRSEELAFYTPILSNALFGSATQGTLTPIINSSAAKSGEAAVINPPSDLVLLGTASGSFRETFALVRNNTKQEERVFRLGDMVYETGRLVEVTRERAFILLNGKKVEILTPMAIPSAGTASNPAQNNSAVANMGGGNYVIDQRTLNAALDNPAQAMTDARLVPSQKDGKVEGFKLSEVKPNGVFGMVGLKNGDVLIRLNDFPVDAPDKALQSFIALKGQSKLKLDLIRDGHPQTLNYDIR